MKLMTNMEHGTLVHSDWIDSFDDSQKEQIILGDLADLDVTIYGKPCYDANQMSEIRYGLLSHVNVDLYVNSRYSARRMRTLRRALEKGIDVSECLKESLTDYQVTEIISKLI